ncbi:cytochrome c oxidase subunit II [Pseudomarimonas salicorniae]|uniref:Cytochrome c oxidase subunit 2 n=1 Tax=Pseudomarimonas salicorniae TaxID=2933270 RepID=A0ABT0GGI6_9GAMM|nr:cytochrome c oxidase subunit II [Lysobacter sp. CAU 1642]MCK7593650.1 cytochrome c oxidase subunit II [Lysobacter sp. CAU 1642]
MKAAGKGVLRAAALAALGMAGLAGAANPERFQLNMTTGATDMAAEVHSLHMLIFGICVVIGIIVFGAMIIAMIRFRKSKGAVAAKWSHNTTAEIIWTVVPILILVGMAVPATKTLFKFDDVTGAEMTVKVTGYQWMWRYEILNYKGESTPVNFVSRLDLDSDRIRQLGSGENPTLDANPNYLLDVDKALVLPTNTKIRFVITADDVIHAWWVPALGWKQDAVPGFVNEAWTEINEPGVYRGQCAELCGKDHGFMPIVVKAVPPSEFQTYLAAETAARDEAARTAQAAAPAPSKG